MELLYNFLPKVGIYPVIKPQGSFYLYADVTKLTNDSSKFCRRILNKHGVVLTPGEDFDSYEGKKFVRFCYSYPKNEILKGIKILDTVFS